MISREYMANHPEVDWSVYKKQNNVPSKVSSNEEQKTENFIIGGEKKNPSMVNTFLGQMPKASISDMFSPENIKEAVNEGAGMTGGAPQAVKQAYQIGKKGLEYINPEAISESLRGKFGEGTISENIEQFGKRIKFGKESAKEEALVPKREFMEEAKGKNITRLKPEKVDIKNVAGMFSEDAKEFTPERIKAIQKAVNNYYKDGDIEKLAEEGSEIFGSTRELSEKELNKLESFVPIEKLNKGKYFANDKVDKFYSPKGDLANAHSKFIKTKSVEDADKLMSELKSEIRKLEVSEKKGTIGDVASSKLEAYRNNLSDLKNDWSKFVKTLPKEQQGKYHEFLKKYAINVGPYEDASFIVRKLASGDFKGILPESIDRLFSNPNPKEQVLKIINDIGPSGWNNLVYNMLSKYKPGDVKSMANAILEGARKGSPIITDEMVQAANHALKRNMISGLVKSGAGAMTGAATFGPIGAAIGAAAPYAIANKDLLVKALGKLRR
jgi:hypothetical protein